VNTLLQRAHTTIADMRTVVVVAEENGASHEILGADSRIVGSKNVDPVLVTLRTILGNKRSSHTLKWTTRLAGKSGVQVI